jgi:hypothetical protein
VKEHKIRSAPYKHNDWSFAGVESLFRNMRVIPELRAIRFFDPFRLLTECIRSSRRYV